MFRSNKDITLIVATVTEVVRAEVSSGRKATLKSFERAERPQGSPLPAAVELALGMGNGKASARTIVLAEDLWTGALDIDERTIFGLEGDELAQMLKFEAETLANLDPMNCHLGFIELSPVPPDTRRFWCTALSAEALSSISGAIAIRGGKLEHFAHPLGLCGPSTVGIPWIEFRPNAAGAFSEPVGGGMPQASIVRPSKTSDRWYRSLEAMFKGELPPEGWGSADAQIPEDYSGTLQSLSDEVSLESWLNGAVARLQNMMSLPVVTPPVPETSPRLRAQVGAVAAILVGTCCATHFFWQSWEMASMQAEMGASNEPAEEKKRLKTEEAPVAKEMATLEEQIETLKNQQAGLRLLAAQSDRFARLLDIIAAGMNEHIVLEEISMQSTGLRLSGRAIRLDAASRLATSLSKPAAGLGWTVHAPALVGENRIVSGGPWTYTIEFEDTLPAEVDETTPVPLAQTSAKED